ncbi:hypothetical protein Arub01_25420 [Actinomadura rubrobrunea]|uniref:TIGR03986 family CRISPR-associated RAMP protein n=1 Tax=Actinomadura rubrobrunea TaxID=115335 RepID=A0A9W6PWQ1_9ACTN|nr:TIGR03986 family CRISPR-associated RAMP protein [Actinomadura rubrobrunea]GLW64298.1 hypothetical protein Arub01_25420 [Actinomadura rubrobrunea]
MTDQHGLDEFLNPYTFVPAFPRENLPEPLRDRRPLGHHRLHPDRWTGKIKVVLTVKTPLLLLDTARAQHIGDDHFVYPVLTRDGRPHLPATAVKGMLRSAYEAITNSRFGVFDVHDGPHTRPLGWRRIADDALDMTPVRVRSVSEDPDEVEVEILEQGWLPAYEDALNKYKGALLNDRLPNHGEKVRACIKGQRSGYKVLSIVPPNYTGERVVEGYAYITGRNAVDKKYERVFYRAPRGGRKPKTARGEGVVRRWNALMASYIDAHTDKELHERQVNGCTYRADEYIANEIGKLAWSPHLVDEERRKLKPGTLCYARIEDGKVLGLYPVLIPRDISAKTPAEMLPESLHPARTYDELSPADRVFGWVAPQGSGTRPAAYRGHLRIGPVTCDKSADEAVTRFDGEGLPLAILSQPKPSQGRFYLAESPDAPHRPVPDGIMKHDLYLGDRGLRGRKVYWHHARVADRPKYWQEPGPGLDPTQSSVAGGVGFREYRRPRKPENEDDLQPTRDKRGFKTTAHEQRDNQNRSIRGWVNQGVTFSFDIHVQDLDEVELGALLWLLSLPRDHFHRLGLGKPLGFGSVRLHIDFSGTSLLSGDQWSEYYRSLSGELPDADPRPVYDKCRQAFEDLLGHESLRHVKAAFLAAASGVPELPVRYPRAHPDKLAPGVPTPPDPRGRSYAWFTANEKTAKDEHKKLKMAKGRGRSLPAAEDRDRTPLPTFKEERSESDKKQRAKR